MFPQSNWVPRRGDQGPKTIDQIHKEAEMEEHREHIKVQQLMAKGSDKRRGGPPGPPISEFEARIEEGTVRGIVLSTDDFLLVPRVWATETP